MLRRSCMLCMVTALVCSAAQADEPAARPDEVVGWGRVVDPTRDCDVALDRVQERLRIEVPGTAHVLSTEVPRLPMNAPRVVRGVRGDFTASVHVLGRLEPGPIKTTHYDPYHGAGLIAWQDESGYLRLERAVGYINGRYRPYVNYELREGGVLTMSRGYAIEDGPLYLKLRRQAAGFSAWYSHDGRRWSALPRVDTAFAERVEVGVVAVNSSGQPLSAELEMWNVEDPQGSMARDDSGHDSEVPPRPVPASSEAPPRPVPASSEAPPRPVPASSEAPPRPVPASSEAPPARPKRMSVLFDTAQKRKPPAGPPAPIGANRSGFHW